MWKYSIIKAKFQCIFYREILCVLWYTTSVLLYRIYLFMLRKKIFLFTMLVGAASLFLMQGAAAGDPKLPINDESYAARYVSQSVPDPVVIEAGTTKTVDFVFKNVGSATWNAAGARYVSAYAVEPKYRESLFASSNWLSTKQTAKLSGVVAPGKTGTLSVQLTAPHTPGEYVERFYLAAENRTWMQGGYFYIKVTVVPKKVVAVPTEKEQETVSATETAKEDVIEEPPVVKAKKIGQSKKTVSVVGGEKVKLVLIYQNTGNSPWDGYQLAANAPSALAVAGRTSFADKKWHGAQLVEATEESVAPRGLLRKTFYFRAPAEQGEYTATFHLASAEGTPIDGSEATVAVTVTADAPDHYTPPTFTSGKKPITSTEKVKNYRLSAEPRHFFNQHKMTIRSIPGIRIMGICPLMRRQLL